MGRYILFFITLLFFIGCAHKSNTHEPKKPTTTSEYDYPMLEDEDVGISRDGQSKSDHAQNSSTSNP